MAGLLHLVCVLALLQVSLAGPHRSLLQETTLRQLAQQRGVYIGAAVNVDALNSDATYKSVLNQEFDIVTAENVMKFQATEPVRGQFTFTQADQLVDNAVANGQAIRGHNFVWHQAVPDWLTQLQGADLQQALHDHITAVGGRYAGKVYGWDVTNEVVEEDGTLRKSFWLNNWGEGYIADAFNFAHQVDPNAKLYINDYNIEDFNAKSEGLYNLVKSLLDQGVPVHGVGFQCHFNVDNGIPARFQENLQRFVDLGVEVAITELDIGQNVPASNDNLAKQATQYAQVVNACLATPKCVSVTLWGFTDKFSWISDQPGRGSALIFDENYQKKPSYYSTSDAFAGGL